MDKHSLPAIPKTYRVRGIPATEGHASATTLLESALCDDECGLKIWSLAPDPSSPQSDLVATVTFKSISGLLGNGGERWTLPEPYSKIIIDQHFRGITPLSEIDSDNTAPV